MDDHSKWLAYWSDIWDEDRTDMPKRHHLDIHTKEAARTILSHILETYNIAPIGECTGVTREAEAWKAHADRKAILQLANILLIVSEQGLEAVAALDVDFVLHDLPT